jgi:hypothetical protein
MMTQPPAHYAGQIGARATVVDVSGDVYVVFDAGVRESFPVGRFRDYFAVAPDPASP